MSVITSSGWMASRLLVLMTLEEAIIIKLVRDAELIPHIETRILCSKNYDIKTDGPINSIGHQTSIFFDYLTGNIQN